MTMRTYGIGWTVAATIVVAPWVVYDVAFGGWLRLLVLGPAMGLVGGFLGFALAEERPDRWTWARRGFVWTGLGTIAADALLTPGGRLGALAWTALLLTSPAVVGTARNQFLAWSTRRTTGPPETLGTRDLLRRWERTTDELMRGGLPVARHLALVEERRVLIDELELRDPDHFDEWMAAAVPGRASPRARGGDGSWRRGS